MSEILTGADLLIRRLRQHGVRHVFGYPGGQLTPIYDALYRDGGIRHVLARDEQAAAFMADGYARATGRPGVCLAVCGPGVYNAATPIASAFTDSIPILLISGQIATAGRGLRSGYYHENEQTDAFATLTKHVAGIDHSREIIPAVDDVFLAMTSGRPGPVLLDFPLDIQRRELRVQSSRADGETALEIALDAEGTEFRVETFPAVSKAPTPPPDSREIEALARLAASWRKPLLLAGGGVVSAGAEAELAQLADRLGAPVFHTFNGKCAMSSRHPLTVGLPWRWSTSDLTNMESAFSPLFAEADGLLAVGCRFTQAATGNWTLKAPPSVAQIDIDPAEIGRHYPVAAGVIADARLSLQALLHTLPSENRPPWTSPPPPSEPWRLPGFDPVGPLRRALPDDAIIAADITRLGYILLAKFPVYEPRTLLHPAGFVPMGYGIPAALGAKAAFPERPVVAVVGDGCFLMSGMELATAVQEDLPIIIILVNDRCLTLIKAIQERKYESRFMGVDLRNPDFGLMARAFGVGHWQADSDAALEEVLRQALASAETCLIEIPING